MFSSLTVTLLALAGAVLAQPNTQPVISTITRNGRQGELRIVNRAVVASTRTLFVQNVNSTHLFTNADIKAHAKIGEAPSTQVGGTVAAGTASAFVKVDTGASNSVQVSIVSPLNETLPICQFSVTDGARTTVVIRTTLTAGTPTTHTGTCAFTDGTPSTSCSQVTVADDAKVTFTCTTVTDQISSTRSCTDQPVRFYNFLTEACDNTHLKRTDVIVPTGTSLFLDAALPTGPTSPNTAVQFNRAQTFKLKEAALALNPSSRFTDVILTDAGINVVTFETAFINVVNAAFRVTGTAPALTLNTTYTLVIVEGTTLTAANVVHIDESFTATEVSGWIEVRAGNYTAFIFAVGTSELQIFGDNSLAMPTTGTATALTSGALPTLAANSMHIVRITSNANSVNGNGNAEPTISSVPLNGNDVAAGTKFITWNQLFDRSILLASPNDTACNLKTGTVAHNAVFTFTTTTTVGPFSVFKGDAKCSALSAPLAPTSISFTHSGGAVCKVQGAFVVGHSVTRNVSQTCIEPATTCTAGVGGLSTITSVTDSNSFDTVAIPAVTMCSCAAAAAAPTCDDVCVADQFANVLNSVEATRAAVLSASATSTSLQGTIRAQLSSFQTNLLSIEKKVKKVDKNVRDIEDDVSDLVKASKKKN